MKHLYKLLALLVTIATAPQAMQAGEWSFAWPVSGTSPEEKANNNANGFYNFGTTFDPERTSITRTLDGRTWTAEFEKGAKLTYLAASGQAVGSTKAFSNFFKLTSDDFTGKIKSVTVEARTKITDATLTVSVNGKPYLCNGNEEAPITTTETTPIVCKFLPDAEGGLEGEIQLYFSLPDAATVTYIRSVTVEWEEASSSVATPAFSPEGGSFDEPVAVTITGPDGATIIFTTDGSNPRTEGNAAAKEYTAPVEITATTRLKAIAKAGDETSAVAEAIYTVRQSPELSFTKESLTIELLEEDIALLNNPYNVSPVKYSSSNQSVAYVDKYGLITTFGIGETVISATFDGNETYKPQTVTLPVSIIAKEPLSGLTITPATGTYDDITEVTVECTDERAETIWYHLGEKPMGVDELGILEDFIIHPAKKMTLKLDHSCTLTVQAMGKNVWSEPLVATYTINMPLKAQFEGGESYVTVYRNGFDSLDEANEWNTSSGSNWQLTPDAGGFRDLPPFSSINPDSKFSIYHQYSNSGDVAVMTSPDITLPDNATVRFYAAFNPVWIFQGNLKLYICENIEGAEPFKIWDALLASQEAATDDVKWNRYTANIADYAGKEVYFAFTYDLTEGDNVIIDDFEVVAPETGSTTISVEAGEPVTFRDLSTGQPDSREWHFPGAVTETSTEQNPGVVYDRPGTYDVTLTVRKGDETSTMTREKYVIVHGVAPTAEIGIPEGVYYSPEAGIVVPLNTPLTFTNLSKGSPHTYAWTLPGTDLQKSDEKDVTVKYTTAGMFDVDLTVSNDAGTSSTYIYGVKTGGESLAWNIAAAENADLGIISLSWYGNYGGTNWLDMEAFAEHFDAPATPVKISGVNIYFGSVATVTPDAEIKVAIAVPDTDGMPGEVLAEAILTANRLVDASETYNDPTEFVFDKPVKLDGEFFVTISGFPNNSGADGEDNIAMYSLRRGSDGHNTAYHLLKETDENYQPTGELKWYAQGEEDACSFAIAPRIVFDNPSSGITTAETDNESNSPAIYYNLQGIRVDGDNLTPGFYIRRQGSKATKIRVR